MSHIFTTITDVHRYASDQLEAYYADSDETNDDLVDRLTAAIINADGFAYGTDMSDLLDRLYDEQHGGWTPLLYDDASPAYAVTADHEYGDPDYHCATLTIGDQWYAYTRGDIDLDHGNLTFGTAYDVGVLDYDDDPDDLDRDRILTDIEDLRKDVRNEMREAAEKAADDYADAEIAAKADGAAEDIDDYAKFLWWSPRGFANECTLYGIKGDDVDEAEAWLDEQDPSQSKWEWMDAEEAREELREGIENAVNLARGFGADNPPCGVTKIIPWSERNA